MVIKESKILIMLACFGLIIFFFYKSSDAFLNESEKPVKSKTKITLMTYNVENLFDTVEDPNKNDETYLPIKKKTKSPLHKKKCKSLKVRSWQSECLTLDWNKTALNSKMKRLADVILKSNKWKGPDILILQEVENLAVVESLRKGYLKKHYPNPAILLEGPDRRGIDVAILTKLVVMSKPKLNILKFKPEDQLTESRIPTTRGILEVQLELPDKTPIYIFGVHFPSQGTPTAARKQALRQLIHLMKSKPKNSLVVAGGDFNITSFEAEKKNYFLKLKPQFLVSHLVGCTTCVGTQYYHPRKSWSFLDVLLFSNSFKAKNAKWNLDQSSIRVFNGSLYQNNKWGSPMKFQLGKYQQGVSDHWPLLADIFLNSTRSKGTRK